MNNHRRAPLAVRINKNDSKTKENCTKSLKAHIL